MGSVDVKRLLELRDRLEARIKELQGELELLSGIKDLLDSIIRSQSITPASELVQRQVDMGKFLETREIRSRGTGELLATMDIYERGLNVKPVKPFNKDKTAFTNFLRSKILERFKQEDEKMVSEGKLSRDDAFNYEVRIEGDNVVGIVIRNYRTQERLREIIRALRWTLERVIEREEEEGEESEA
ncbi:hypothetical protein [Vulcanisaeta thermophila]|uniref:hypothetical protein n=1 Tax=Vulcanisaeta thermophila TaxID=867917 RepID=UPI000AD77BC1|nr:hypothetical protein [Vulcanisaeta thermophila]